MSDTVLPALNLKHQLLGVASASNKQECDDSSVSAKQIMAARFILLLALSLFEVEYDLFDTIHQISLKPYTEETINRGRTSSQHVS